MAGYLNSHMAEFWFLLGFILLAIELVAFGMASGVLLFAGIGALITGGLLALGILPETWIAGIASLGVSSSISAVLLWKPLKSIQDNSNVDHTPTSDLIGYKFRLDQDVTTTAPGRTQYSGIEWKVEIALDAGVDAIAAGEIVEVSSVDAGLFRVKLSS